MRLPRWAGNIQNPTELLRVGMDQIAAGGRLSAAGSAPDIPQGGDVAVVGAAAAAQDGEGG